MVFFEGSPSAGDLAVNVLLGITLIWLPLTAAAVGRFAFVKYRVTDKRMTVTTKAPWQGSWPRVKTCKPINIPVDVNLITIYRLNL